MNLYRGFVMEMDKDNGGYREVIAGPTFLLAANDNAAKAQLAADNAGAVQDGDKVEIRICRIHSRDGDC